MDSPAIALGVVFVFLGVCGLLFWPSHGYFWRWRTMSDRILIEDALKHFYHVENEGGDVSLQSLAGALEISGDRAARLMARLELVGQVARSGNRVFLTDSGRMDALRMIRVHRLWERHLAEETGVEEAEWHSVAEWAEHDISDEDANRISERLGDPRFDPHGDPIPTPAGDVPPRLELPLSGLLPNELGLIVHLEDEPEAVYAQLVAEGLKLGMQVRVVDVTPSRVTFLADGEARILAPVCAANVFVQQIAKEEEVNLGETLSQLKVGELARVVRIDLASRGLERRRLMDLGILPGTPIQIELTSAWGDPIAYRIRGAVIALRKEQSNRIYIERQEPHHGAM